MRLKRQYLPIISLRKQILTFFLKKININRMNFNQNIHKKQDRNKREQNR